MQDTAFEWFLKNIPERFKNAFLTSCHEEIQKTRELEKGQIMDAWDDGQYYANYGHNTEIELDSEEYYNHKYEQTK
jgi:hypothetical protein